VSLSAWPCDNHGQACHRGVSAVVVEAFMNNAGLERDSALLALGRSIGLLKQLRDVFDLDVFI
jgi:hypothetical protein